ncbi:hypothetical protein EBU71_10830 [bacterium]|nr:hypothetical protein [Candidatus Elulimicrobium humile]
MIERKKIAMVLSGHLRTYAVNFPYLKENLLDHHDVDIYIATWDKNYIGPEYAPTVKIKHFNDDEILNAVNIYPNLKHIHIGRADEVAKLSNSHITAALNAKKMFYWPINDHRYIVKPGWKSDRQQMIKLSSTWHCIQETFKLIENPNQYDFIMRNRFDIKFLQPIKFLDKDLVVTQPAPIHAKRWMFRNYFFYSKPYITELMCRIYELTLNTMFKYRNFSAESVIEYIFKTELTDKEIYLDPELKVGKTYLVNGRQ